MTLLPTKTRLSLPARQRISCLQLLFTSVLTGIALLFSLQPAYAGSPLDKARSQAQQLISEEQLSQQRIDQTLSASATLDQEFVQLSKALEQININLRHQQQIQKQQAQQLVSLTRQLDSVATTENSLIPMMLNMIEWLEEQIETGLPFHLTERRNRVAELKRAVLSPELSLAEIYQSVLDAYEVEREFGYSIETYQQNIDFNGQSIDSRILRIGRVGLYYLTLDKAHGGVWNQQAQQWQTADAKALREIQEGILIARKQQPHRLLSLPLSVGVDQ